MELIKMCDDFLSTKKELSIVDSIIEQEIRSVKHIYGYDDIKKDVEDNKKKIKDWLIANKKDLYFEFITKYESDAEEYAETVFPYCDIDIEIEMSDNRYDYAYYIHSLGDEVIIYEEIAEWESIDGRFNLVGLYKAVIK